MEGIRQFFVLVEREAWKLETLCDLYEVMNEARSVVYCNSRRRAEGLADELIPRGFTVSLAHGGLDQREREQAVREFSAGNSQVLIATDLVARGLIPQAPLVINYDLPGAMEAYLHRVGRVGRFGRKGLAVNFVEPGDVEVMRNIERFYQTTIEELPADVEGLL